ncbi:MAG TPA: hypothetical protein V6D11_25240 [Waterburya sp.]
MPTPQPLHLSWRTFILEYLEHLPTSQLLPAQLLGFGYWIATPACMVKR